MSLWVRFIRLVDLKFSAFHLAKVNLVTKVTKLLFFLWSFKVRPLDRYIPAQ